MVEPAVVMTTAASREEPAPQPPRITLRQRIEALGLKFGITLARCLPVSWVTGIGATIVGFGGPWLRQHRRALANLEIAFPEKSPAERQAIARAMWANMGRTFAEMMIFDRIALDPATVEIVDEAHWRDRMGAPVPGICCTLHLGSWELTSTPLNRFGRKPAGVYRPLGNPLIDQWLVATRTPAYPGGLLGKGNDDVRSGQRTARRLIDLARKGGAIGFACDHYERRGDPIAFMGREAKFTTIPASIARHVGARVFVGACIRVGKSSRFRMELRELEVPRTSDRSADAIALTTAIFAEFERWIRAHPEQWMWWNTRWVKRT